MKRGGDTRRGIRIWVDAWAVVIKVKLRSLLRERRVEFGKKKKKKKNGDFERTNDCKAAKGGPRWRSTLGIRVERNGGNSRVKSRGKAEHIKTKGGGTFHRRAWEAYI